MVRINPVLLVEFPSRQSLTVQALLDAFGRECPGVICRSGNDSWGRAPLGRGKKRFGSEGCVSCQVLFEKSLPFVADCGMCGHVQFLALELLPGARAECVLSGRVCGQTMPVFLPCSCSRSRFLGCSLAAEEMSPEELVLLASLPPSHPHSLSALC